jgi:type II secretory pathway pseudopilin PulG
LAGFSLVEVLIAGSILIFAVLAISQSTVSSMRLGHVNREGGLAQAALRQALENLQAQEFEDIFALYNSAPGDDPGVAGSAPGPGFAVAGLNPLPDDADGFVGEFILPEVVVGGSAQLRETYNDAAMGMPRDLDGDALQDDLDKAADYQILPVRVRLQWQGKAGPRVLETRTMVTDR